MPRSKLASKSRSNSIASKAAPGPKISADLTVSAVIGSARGLDRLTFDGYKLTWHGSGGNSWTAFSGTPNESADEATPDIGPTPQGLFAVDPGNVEDLIPSDDWGSHRVKIEPYAATVDRMKDCFKVIRTGMYIHGGNVTGTRGCIEINNDAEESEFFKKLVDYGKKIELEVRYSGAREKKYEASGCPYPPP